MAAMRHIAIIWLLISAMGISSCATKSVRNQLAPFSTLVEPQKKSERIATTSPDTNLDEYAGKETIGNNPAKLAPLSEELQKIESDVSGNSEKIKGIDEKITGLTSEITEIKELISKLYEKGDILPATGAEENTRKPKRNDFVILPDEKFNLTASKTKTVSKPARRSKNVEKALPKSTTIKIDNFEQVYSESEVQAPEYHFAIDLLTHNNFTKAIFYLKKALEKENTAIAISECNYYLGESHLGLNQYEKAIIHFTIVINGAQSDKKDDAQVKIAEAYVKSGKQQEAKEAFITLINDYPRSSYLPKARKMVQQL